MNIPITKTVFGDCENDAVAKVLKSGWVVQGPNVAEFERRFADFTGTRFARATTSCTTALHLALEALGIGRGDRVIVPSFTYIASANAVEYTGAEVVFCDIDLKTFNLDMDQARRILEEDKEKRVKAIMPVHLFGLCSDMVSVMKLAREFGLKVVEDAACAAGAFIERSHAGTFGDAGCFSFHPRKSISTGEGGMVVTDNETLDAMISSLRDHGASKSDLTRHKEKGGSLLPDFNIKGYNYRMTDIQGAIGVCQMEKVETILTGRAKVARRYDVALRDVDSLLTPHVPQGYVHGYQSYVCIFTNGEGLSQLTKDKIDRLNVLRNHFMERLEAKGIATRQGTHAVHTLGYYKNTYKLQDEDYLSAYAADRLSITLPLYAGMSEEEFNYVIREIKAQG